MKYNSEHILKSQKGSTYPVIIAVVLVIIAAAASAADIGYSVYQHYTLVSATRQAAVKGAEKLQESTSADAAEQAIKKNIMRSVKDLSKFSANIPDNCREITVSVKKPFEYFFVKYFGADKSELNSRVTVRLTGVMAITNVRPFGILQKDLKFGSQYTLTNSKKAASGSNLKVVPLQLGTDKFKNTVLLGYADKLKVNDMLSPFKGMNEKVAGEVSSDISALIGNCSHKPKCTYEKYENDCSRIIILPVISGTDKNGQYKISGFTAFFLEKGKTDGDCFYITGRFIKHTVKADMSDGVQNYGLAAIRVIDN